MADPLDPSKTLMFCDTDWQSLLFRPSMWQNYYVGVDGGGKSVRYNFSLGYLDDEGIGLGTGYSKISAKSNIEAKITKNLTATFNVGYQYTTQDSYASQRNAISRALSATPVQMVYYEDGTPVPGYNEASETPIFYNHYRDNSTIRKNLTGSGELKWEILPGWTANLGASYFDMSNKNTTFIRANYDASNRPSYAGINITERVKADAFTQYKHTFAGAHEMMSCWDIPIRMRIIIT